MPGRKRESILRSNLDMDNFVYQNPVRTHFGRGQLQCLAEEVGRYSESKRILLVYGERHLRATGTYDRVAGILQNAGIGFEELPGVHSNPRVSLVREGIEICRANHLDFVLGVGGGSTADTAKAIAAGLKLDGDVWNAYEDFHTRKPESEKKHLIREAIPLGVVMTKAGTGSDFDCTSVMSNWETHEKLRVIYSPLFPKFSICDPELTYTVPRDQTAYGVADMMTHVFEQYFSHTLHAPAQDRIKEGLLKTMIEFGPIAIQEPENYDARANLLFCASWACSLLAHVGVVNDWASHSIEHELSAITDLNHGLGMAIVYPGWMRHVIEHGPAKFAQYGERVWGLSREGRADLDVGLEAIDRTREAWEAMGIAVNLEDAGVASDVLPQAARQAVRFGPIGAYRPLEETNVLEILNSVSRTDEAVAAPGSAICCSPASTECNSHTG
jgi:alcohol dehydrogenase YqhD (iron-dependent ADH family)